MECHSHICSVIDVYMEPMLHVDLVLYVELYIDNCYTHPYIYVYKCHRHGKGFRRETMRFGISVIFGIFGVDAGRCADELWQFFCTCTAVFPLKY